MKSIEISNKVHLIRHWGRWYRVQRGAAQWQPLKPLIAQSLAKPITDPLLDNSKMTPAQAQAELERRIRT